MIIIKNAFIKQSSTFINRRLGRIKLNSGSSTKHRLPNFLIRPFSNYQKYEDLYKLRLTAYAQAFLTFVLLLFVALSLAKMASRTRFGILSMGGAEKGIRITMEVDSIVVEMATKSFQVAPDITESVTELCILQPYLPS